MRLGRTRRYDYRVVFRRAKQSPGESTSGETTLPRLRIVQRECRVSLLKTAAVGNESIYLERRTAELLFI